MTYQEMFFEACDKGSLDEIERLLALRMFWIFKRINVNATDKNGNTALYCAAKGGHKDMAEFLIAKGADVNARNNDGFTPLHYAALIGQEDVAALLIAK